MDAVYERKKPEAEPLVKLPGGLPAGEGFSSVITPDYWSGSFTKRAWT
jgi:hypothetical protein